MTNIDNETTRRIRYLLDSLSGAADRMGNYGDDFHLGVCAGLSMAVECVREILDKKD